MSEFCNNLEPPHQSAEELPRLTKAEVEKIINGSGPLDLVTYNALQEHFINSADNRWYAGENFGCSASKEELRMYFIEHGGAEWFAKTFRPRYEAYLAQKNAINKE